MFTDFGFKTIKDFEKEKLVKELFQGVSGKYDVMNDAMSFGLHRLWKKHFIKYLPIKQNDYVLDLASGTGDIAFQILKKFKPYNPSLMLCDLTDEMLFKAKEKSINEGLLSNIEFVVGSAEKLPFVDDTFDGVTISFGLRNTTHKLDVLKEIYRTLKPNGWFYCLEFSKPTCDLFSKFYDFYSFNIIPKMGKIIANDEDAYQYLVESIKQFPDQETLKSMMLDVGFKNVSFDNLTNGIVAVHHGKKNNF
ncbi:MAG: bifunctional demethylmenaquinone methyltransferase/2-methoxy-6-polyprenyl-1,4-benzoquinol methylase UbiE [Proteobacteria bacterium]|nr:bifunctional demethylmenaquinone methyltransferase/2-methoxy-6-polyprenyl-1,4-benzoquinol methylase UbiE [Pseudomonadota bacterium]